MITVLWCIVGALLIASVFVVFAVVIGEGRREDQAFMEFDQMGDQSADVRDIKFERRG